ncbi:hypothetical protein [Neochlamydia sp. AcF95]|uniref:preprotein translocase subunit SecA n=1 Tax=Neochlamydia sp. AcF95 TaxID=2795734 RepID=UPI001BC8D179|nr:hypothetical protein [Neochlamydia sp. AcF95]MBS4171235.1 Uncharacterized protein [Neochlamydia sp. AcF95]
MNSIEIDPVQWLSGTERSTFQQLTSPLKEIFEQYLYQIKGNEIDIISVALGAIRVSHEPNELFLKQREKFFVCLLSNAKFQTQPTWNKVLEIAQKGFLGEFLHQIDNKKKAYHSIKTLISLVDQFHADKLPSLIHRKQKSQLSNSLNIPESSLILQAYTQIYDCQTYYALPKLIDEFLSHLSTHQKWESETYACLFYSLNITYNIKFDEFEKLKLYKTIFSLHSPERLMVFEHSSEVDVKEFLSLCLSLKNKVGEELLDDYLTSLNQTTEWTLSQAMKNLKFLLKIRKNDNFYALIDQWKNQHLEWNFLVTLSKDQLKPTSSDETFFQDSISQRLTRFKRDPTITQPLHDRELHLIFLQYQTIEKLCTHYKQLEFHELLKQAHSIRNLAKTASINEENRLNLIAIGRVAIWLEFGIYPFSTQILALLALLLDGKSRQGQVKTGEGKSTIIALWAFVMAMECRAIDVITSARYLAIRDHDKFATFFKKCGITISHICRDRKRPEDFEAQILYGPAFDFEFAWMEDMLWGSKLYQQRLKIPYIHRNFDVVMVDESDNLLVDNAQNGARLGCPTTNSYEWIYAPILLFVREHKEIVKENQNQALILLKSFLNHTLNLEQQKMVNQLQDDQLQTWLRSAHHVLFELSLDKEYIIKVKKTPQGHAKRTIQIVNLDTGRVSENSRWANGIHEFLEVKHDILVEKETLSPLSLSHAVFYKFYHTITALTGTAERFQTREIYHIESFDVPPHRPLQRQDFPILFVPTTEKYHSTILQNVKQCIQIGRPCLVLCATIKETKELATRLSKEKINVQILNEVQEELEHVILNRAGESRMVTIATNTAGRGTDIVLSQESLQNGGLHVLLTFYPDSQRVEDQAIGRAGRQGQPGSSQIIVNKECLEIKELISQQGEDLTDTVLINLLKRQRDLKEKSLATIQVFQAELQRFLAAKTEHFFSIFRQWSDHVAQDSTLERYAERLCSLRIASKKSIDFSSLAGLDLVLAEECLSLLITKRGQLAWKIFLKKIVERLKEKAIEEWVNNFFENAEEQLRRIAHILGKLKLELDQTFEVNLQDDAQAFSNQEKRDLFQLITEHFLRNIEEHTEAAKREINQKFDAHQLKWNNYFSLDGSGLMIYLKEITSINFLPILKR